MARFLLASAQVEELYAALPDTTFPELPTATFDPGAGGWVRLADVVQRARERVNARATAATR